MRTLLITFTCLFCAVFSANAQSWSVDGHGLRLNTKVLPVLGDTLPPAWAKEHLTPEEYENLKVIGRVYVVDYSFLNKRAFYEPKCRARVYSTLAKVADRVRRGEEEAKEGCQMMFAVSSDLDRNVRWETFVEGNETGMQTGMHRAVVYTGMQSALAQVMLVVTYRYNPDTQEVSDIVAKLHSLDPNAKLGGAANFNYQKDRKRLQGSMDAVLQYQDVLGEWHLECFDKEFLIPLNLY